MKDKKEIKGDISLIASRLDFSRIGIEFQEKPVIVGGLAMEYYGLRPCGDDIDVIICEEDYQKLSEKYPENRVDTWGDLCVELFGYSFMRSISRLDLDFYKVDAIEYPEYKLISFERLFFMTGAAVRSEPEVPKRVEDFGLALGRIYEEYRNVDYVLFAEKNQAIYEKAHEGTVYQGKYVISDY